MRKKRISKEGARENGQMQWSLKFFKQQEAIEWAEKQNEKEGQGLNQQWKVWTREYKEDGRRYFICARYYGFKNILLPDKKRAERTYYEIIQDGHPCQLYFDIEYETAHNPEHDSELGMQVFREYLLRKLRAHPAIQAKKEEVEFVELDATTSKKFSRHLIVRIKGKAFKSAIHAGAFVKDYLRKHLLKDLENEELLKAIFINKSDPSLPASGEKVWFVDEGVYTRNRCFRLVDNVKYKYRLKEENGGNPHMLRRISPVQDFPEESEYKNWRRSN